jgi:hypothetical protein
VILKNQAAGRCLANESAHGGDNGAAIAIYDCSPSDWAQMWALTAK